MIEISQDTSQTARSMPLRPFGGDTPTTNLDLILALLIAFGLPWLTLGVLHWTGGALTSLFIYYVVCGVLLYRWRLGSLDYDRPTRWPWAMFLLGVLLAGAITFRNWNAFADAGAPWWGIWLTAVIWGGVNAALEQFSWLYVLIAWRNRWATGWQQKLGLIIGSFLLLTLVTLIHIIFWAEVLPEARQTGATWLTVPLNTLLTLTYVVMYFQARSFWPTFLVHFLVDLQIVILARYSIVPYL
ncbi:hypothetical protein EYB53_023865 [Candidatus Chloroploca sp. M-50]|uniref:CPBP family intramembrane metalloprotease n=1 Tax=Candidatus Chloroploca mongolica TaxID=2528176 RepID=A0ABS4DH68_9CHLR|nr:hypothetical protein [Candidatus Chloroploca mongolica]MBP1468768.1 hypothetical protein [Candidatus Chloroploca mongolica]